MIAATPSSACKAGGAVVVGLLFFFGACDTSPLPFDAAADRGPTDGGQVDSAAPVDAGGPDGDTNLPKPDAVVPVKVYDCVKTFTGHSYTKSYDWNGTTTDLGVDTGNCSYDYSTVTVPDQARFDQRGVDSYQVTFPMAIGRWWALALGGPGPLAATKSYCYAGGTHVGRNPLSMTWGGDPGSKRRKNNFLRITSGKFVVEGVRLHNMHDPFYGMSNAARYEWRHVWASWIRDDFYEGRLHHLGIHDTLIDGSFAFLSDPDAGSDGCTAEKNASGETLVIENSLIRLQRQPGPYPGDTWFWKIEGGHGQLWKHTSCGWAGWPQFELRNNVFLIEGPATTKWNLNDTSACTMGLPSACDSKLSNLSVCENNLFLYTQYHHWTTAGKPPGAVPQPGGKYHNANNPKFSPNGVDCYQRVTDDWNDPGYGNVMGIWRARRQKWIAAHTGHPKPVDNIMQIPGVDLPGLTPGKSYGLRNKSSGQYAQSQLAGGVTMAACNSSTAQKWTVEAYDDGKLMGALLFRNSATGGVLRTQSPQVLEADNSDSGFDTKVVWDATPGGTPGFAERWYVIPLEDEPGGEAKTYSIESDALRRSYVYVASGGKVEVQRFFVDLEQTPLPQAEFNWGAAAQLQWYFDPL